MAIGCTDKDSDLRDMKWTDNDKGSDNWDMVMSYTDKDIDHAATELGMIY